VSAALDAAGEGDLVLVTGSLYTVADARRTLLGGRDLQRSSGRPVQEEP